MKLFIMNFVEKNRILLEKYSNIKIDVSVMCPKIEDFD